MALIDKLYSPENKTGPDVLLLSAHRFSSSVNLWALGIVTRANVISNLGLEVSDEAQLDQLSSHYTALTANEKSEFFGKLESLLILLEIGDITNAQFKTLLDLS